MGFADERRASGQRNTEDRRASGQRNTEDRRASGQRNTEDRRASGRKMRDDMRALAESNRPERKLPVLPIRGGQAAMRGNANWEGAAPTTGGGGIDSPLTETAREREYYSQTRLSVSNTFLEAMELKMLKTIKFTDKFDVPVVLHFSNDVQQYD